MYRGAFCCIDLLQWIEVALLLNLSMGTGTDVVFVARFPFKEGINDLYLSTGTHTANT